MYGTLKGVFAECDPSTTMLLVDRKRGNAPLRTLLNCLSRDGHRVHVHGVDSDDPATMRGKLCVSTWWAAKGMECDTAIVVVPRFTPRNPFYVALTRARRKLVVVFDPQEPHSSLCEAAYDTPSDEDSFDETLRSTWIRPPTSAGALRHVDGWRAPRSLIDAYTVDHVVFVGDDLSDLSSTFTTDDGRTEDCAHAIFRMALLHAEWRVKGRMRAMSDVLLPVRIDRSRQAEAIALGLSARSVSMMRFSADMLSTDIRILAQGAFQALARTDVPTATCLADISLAVLAWDNFDHASRQLMPTSLWSDKEVVGKVMHNAMLLFKDATDFDVILRTVRGDDLAYLRTHAVSDGGAYHAVWGEESVCLSHDTLSRAIMHASLHESGSCTVVDLCRGWSRRVRVAHPHVILDSALQSE